MTKTEKGTFIEYKITENNGLAFDHARIITYALERLRGKVEYSGLALHLMPPEFTLTQLQQVYEVILGKRLLKAAFRRKRIPTQGMRATVRPDCTAKNGRSFKYG